MFQRRLLFLALAMGAGMAFPVIQMSRLTLAKGDDLRAEAEKRLVSESYLETSRGRILDCKGRELARDKPSLDIAVDYSVITGRWADVRAARVAKKASEASGHAWVTLSPEEREAAIKAARVPFDLHMQEMWNLFASTAGITVEQVEQRKQEIKEQVQYLATVVTENERRKEEARLRATGSEAAVPTSAIKVSIQEQKQAHVMLRGVTDTIGLEFERIKDLTDDDENSPLVQSNTSKDGKAVPLFPGLRVVDSSRREYPLDVMEVEVDTSVFPPPLRGGIQKIRVPGVAMHEIGRMRGRLYKEDLDRRPRMDPSTGTVDRGHYRPGDSVGHGGAEQAREEDLRGLRGMKIKHLDTGKEEEIPRLRGRDVNLTIDAALEARIQALFDPSLGLTVVQPWHRTKTVEEEVAHGMRSSEAKPLPVGTPLNGAVVVIEVKTGNIVSMVSMPSYTHDQIETMPETIANDTYNQAFLNRAIGKAYPPGSIVKPLVLCEAMERGKYSPGEQIACTGHFYTDKPLLYRCWIYKQFQTTHSARLQRDLDGADAIRCSCNIFFFKMGDRLGPEGIHRVFSEFGVGADSLSGGGFNIFQLPALPKAPKDRVAEQRRRGLLSEAAGEVKNPAKATPQEALLMAIGQGPLTWTPLHAANAYATLARRGEFITPRLFEDAQQERRDLKIPERAIKLALKGLHGSANEEYGTTHTILYALANGTNKQENVFTAPGIDVWAKSGTADTSPFRAELSQQDGRDELYDSDHSWCVCLVGDGSEGGAPKFAIACVLDYGGSGGRVAGPLANQVVYALKAEGYLR
jgi:penicillin-binding protein 2